jgi:hypothetical protein
VSLVISYDLESKDYIGFLREVAEPGEIFVNVSTWLFPDVKPYYMVSNYGRILNKYTQKFLALVKYSNSFDCIRLNAFISKSYTKEARRQIRVDKLVLYHFKPIPYMFDMDVIHLDGDNFNNKIDNLEYDIERWKRVIAEKRRIEELKAHIEKFGVNYTIKPLVSLDVANGYGHFISHHSVPRGNTIQGFFHIPGTSYVEDPWSKAPRKEVEKKDFKKEDIYQLSYTDVCNICKWFSEHPLSHEISQLERIPYFLEMLRHFNYFCRPINGMLELCNNIFDRKIYTNISDKYIF